MKKLKPEGLSQFVRMVQTLCPRALTDLDAKWIQIKVDALSRDSFDRIIEEMEKTIIFG